MSRGFVALMSVIIISIVLVLLTVSLSFSSFYGRFNLLDTEFKIQSNNLATSCADMALLKLRLNSSYNLVFPGETVIVVGDSCTIKSLTLTPLLVIGTNSSTSVCIIILLEASLYLISTSIF
jgi:hypothetical protein